MLRGKSRFILMFYEMGFFTRIVAKKMLGISYFKTCEKQLPGMIVLNCCWISTVFWNYLRSEILSTLISVLCQMYSPIYMGKMLFERIHGRRVCYFYTVYYIEILEEVVTKSSYYLFGWFMFIILIITTWVPSLVQKVLISMGNMRAWLQQSNILQVSCVFL